MHEISKLVSLQRIFNISIPSQFKGDDEVFQEELLFGEIRRRNGINPEFSWISISSPSH